MRKYRSTFYSMNQKDVSTEAFERVERLYEIGI
jgi:hypothetical protein